MTHTPYGECPASVKICPEVDCDVCRGNKTTTPTPPPKFTKNCMCDKYTNCTDCQQHDAAIAAQVREDERNIMIREFWEWALFRNVDTNSKIHGIIYFEGSEFQKFLQSLRTKVQP
jgi:hypothetical protein